MGRRRQSDAITPDDVVVILSRLPAWVGPVLVVFVYASLRWAVPWLLEDPHLKDTLEKRGTMDMAAPIMKHGIGGASRMVAPFIAGILAFLWVVAEVVKRLAPRPR